VRYALTGWLPTVPIVPVTLGVVVASAVAGWVLFRHRLPHAMLGFPALAVTAALLVAGPVDVSVNRGAELGIRLVPVLYGMPAPDSIERAEAGELDLRGCILPVFPKSHTVRIGLNPFG
jgi:hypothetical protein